MTSALAQPTNIVARAARHLPRPLRRWAARLPGPWAPPVEAGTQTPSIAIIGAGFGGLGLAARLRQAGIESFTIHEKADGIGGTWRDNTYPGAACDVPSHLYSLSFAPKADWTRKFPEQPEILAYLHDVAERFDLFSAIRFGSEVTDAAYDEAMGQWHLTFVDGSTDTVDIVVSATGQLNRPFTPPIEGLDDFAGARFHSARWDHGHDVAGRDVAVVGVGASAIQFVPEVAKTAASVTLFQRSVNYVAPKPDAEFSDRAKTAFARVPGFRAAYRASIWARFDARWLLFRRDSRVAKVTQAKFDQGLRPLVSNDLPAGAVVPDYPVGCKRLLISNEWYPTLLQHHVTVVTDPVERISDDGVIAGGRHHEVDTLIFGTGFASTGFLTPMTVTGRGGQDLHEQWRGGAEAHLGLTVAGFPNLFMLYGPNTNLGHNSIIFMIERQIGYILTCVRAMAEQDLGTLDVRAEVQARSNGRLVRELDRTVWAANCHSWYKTASGRITNNWSGPSVRYWLRTAWPRLADFTASKGPAAGR